jgi:hypothetical protein
MITWFLFLIGILSVFALFVSAHTTDNEGLGLFSAIILVLVFAFGIWIETISEPEAIDVYRGNTTLRITYQDSIPVDSVVVFKK